MSRIPQVKKAWDMVDNAKREIENLSPQQLSDEMASSDDTTIVDIRDSRELYLKGKIPGAASAPRGMLEFWIDPESPYHKEIFNQDKTYVFYCASAWRSALSAKTAMDMGLKPVLHIEGGFMAWKKADGDVETLD